MPFAVSAGVPLVIPINPATIKAVRLSNTSPFDMQHSGFGASPGGEWLAAGTERMLYASENIGDLYIIPFNNSNVIGTGNVLVTQYLHGDNVPQGNWPATIPTQIVQAQVLAANTLSNENSISGSKIIDIGIPGNSDLIDIFNIGSATWKMWDNIHSVVRGVFTIPSTAPILNPVTMEFTSGVQVDGILRLLSSLQFNNNSVHSISDINIVQASLNNTFSLVAHGLSLVPSIVLGVENQSALDASPGNLIYDKAGSDGTNMRVCWNAGSTARTILLFCLA